MDGASLECFIVSREGAFTIKECSSLPHSKINTKPSLGFHIRWLLTACLGLPVSPLYKQSCVVIWVVSPSKDRVSYSLVCKIAHFTYCILSWNSQHWVSHTEDPFEAVLSCFFMLISHRKIKSLIFGV